MFNFYYSLWLAKKSSCYSMWWERPVVLCTNSGALSRMKCYFDSDCRNAANNFLRVIYTLVHQVALNLTCPVTAQDNYKQRRTKHSLASSVYWEVSLFSCLWRYQIISSFSLGNTMWLDPLVERKYLKNINVTTNVVNIRLELLKGKRATEHKQVGIHCTHRGIKNFKGVYSWKSSVAAEQCSLGESSLFNGAT